MRKFFGGVVPFSGDPEKYIDSAWPEKVCNSEKMKHKKDKRNTTGKVYLYLACFFIMKKIK